MRPTGSVRSGAASAAHRPSAAATRAAHGSSTWPARPGPVRGRPGPAPGWRRPAPAAAAAGAGRPRVRAAGTRMTSMRQGDHRGQGLVVQPVQEDLQQPGVGALVGGAGHEQQVRLPDLLQRVLDRGRRLIQQQPPGQPGQVDDLVLAGQRGGAADRVGGQPGDLQGPRLRPGVARPGRRNSTRPPRGGAIMVTWASTGLSGTGPQVRPARSCAAAASRRRISGSTPSPNQ